jgi:hypothetical protein
VVGIAVAFLTARMPPLSPSSLPPPRAAPLRRAPKRSAAPRGEPDAARAPAANRRVRARAE